MQHLIGINGFKTAGKDTTYSIIRDIYGNTARVARAGFADKLKVLAAKTLGYSDLSDAECVALMDEAKERWTIAVNRTTDDVPVTWEGSHIRLGTAQVVEPVVTITGREYLQNIGNEARAVFGDSFWVDQVLPSPRFGVENEAWNDTQLREAARRYPDVDVLCITDARYPNEAQRIKELGGVVWEVLRPGLVSDGHSSEKPLPPSLVDYRIVNDGDLETLKVRVMTAMETLS